MDDLQGGYGGDSWRNAVGNWTEKDCFGKYGGSCYSPWEKGRDVSEGV